MSDADPVPGSIRLAGALVCAQAVAGLAFAVALVVRGSGDSNGSDGANVLGEAGYFAVLGAGVLAVGVALAWGRRWARTPAFVVQLLLLGVAWYALGPSGRPEIGVPLGLVGFGISALLLSPTARAWINAELT